jgi:peptidoglycan/xylan/chitin deacetylase (PgdA/CDA1 family)
MRVLARHPGRVASPFAPTGTGRLVAVNFHYVRPSFDDPYPGVHGCTPAAFEAQLRALGAAGDFVSLDDLLAAVDGRAPLPARALLVTFDDGLREQAEHALPVLDRLGVPAAFFVNTAPLAEGRLCTVHKIHLLRARVAPPRLLTALQERAARMGVAFDPSAAAAGAAAQYRYDAAETAQLKFALNFTLARMDRDALVDGCFRDLFCDDERALADDLYMGVDALRELAARGWLGSHGHAHLPLATVSADDARRDLARALDCLERWTGVRPRAMSYPYGSRAACTPAVAEVARALGARVAFTMERAGNADLRTPLLLARLDGNDAPGGAAPLAGATELFERLPAAAWWRA